MLLFMVTKFWLIADEYIDSYVRSGQSGVLCKLDIEQAYDHVSQDFHMLTVEKTGFLSR